MARTYHHSRKTEPRAPVKDRRRSGPCRSNVRAALRRYEGRGTR